MENFFSKKIFNTNRSNEKLPEKILPSDVRYALQYKEGLLNKSDLEILAMSNFENEAAYLALKNLRNEPEKHKILFEKYIGFINKIININIL